MQPNYSSNLMQEFVIPSSEKIRTERINLNRPIQYTNDNLISIGINNEPDFFKSEKQTLFYIGVPKVICKRLWLQLHSEKNMLFVALIPAKNNKCYWIITDFAVRLDQNGAISSFLATRITPLQTVIEEVNELYKRLLSIEVTMGVEVAEKYFEEFLRDQGKTFYEYMTELCYPRVNNHPLPKNTISIPNRTKINKLKPQEMAL